MHEQIRRIGARPVIVAQECSECFNFLAPASGERGQVIEWSSDQVVVLSSGQVIPVNAIGLVDQKLYL